MGDPVAEVRGGDRPLGAARAFTGDQRILEPDPDHALGPDPVRTAFDRDHRVARPVKGFTFSVCPEFLLDRATLPRPGEGLILDLHPVGKLDLAAPDQHRPAFDQGPAAGLDRYRDNPLATAGLHHLCLDPDLAQGHRTVEGE